MNKNEIYDLMNHNPVFFLATLEGNQPRVRGMLLYKADESGIIFHTGKMRDLYSQVMNNPKVEMCFNDFKTGLQLRVRGELEVIQDNNLKDEIAQHPTREFLKPWRESISQQEFYDQFVVFRLKNAIAITWNMAENFAPKTDIKL